MIYYCLNYLDYSCFYYVDDDHLIVIIMITVVINMIV